MNWHLGSSQRPPLEYAMPHEFGHPVRHTLLVPDWFVSAPNRYSIGGDQAASAIARRITNVVWASRTTLKPLRS
jgi:hypothetical protein